MNRSSTIRNILLVVIGVNTLILTGAVQLSTTANIIFLVLGATLLVIGVYFTGRDLLLQT